MVRGPDVVHAVADGHRAARSIDAYLLSDIRQENIS
jgi:NADPH-dependent glutamate synthase beta subunit-like oxidoreductase